MGLFGDRLHFVGRDGPAESEDVAAKLTSAGLPMPAIRVIPPTLEDVFVSAIGGPPAAAQEEVGWDQRASASAGPPTATHGGPALATRSGPTLQTGNAKANGNTPAVAVDGLERRFGNFMAVNRVSFEVRRGEIFGFLGPNGAGKSTTIRMLCGILLPTGGRGHGGRAGHPHAGEQIKARVGYMARSSRSIRT